MSSKAAKRRKGYEERQNKRLAEEHRQKAIRDAKGIKELAAAMGIKLR
jgi:hypothetical protein